MKEVITSFLNIFSSSTDVLRTPVENSKSPEKTASITDGIGISSKIVCETAEKKIIEKHTVSMFFDAQSTETVIVSGIDIS